MFLDGMKMILKEWDLFQFEPFDAWRFDNEQTFLMYLWETLVSPGLTPAATAALCLIHAVSNWLCLEISFNKKKKKKSQSLALSFFYRYLQRWQELLQF